MIAVSVPALALPAKSADGNAHAVPASYTWKQLKTGAGGWITGISIQPDDRVIYARTDTGGAYRLDQATRTWVQIVTARSLPAQDVRLGAYGGVTSLVGAPSDDNRAYMAASFGMHDTNVYRSNDQGRHWERTALIGVKDDANGEGRQMGERLAVDPANADIVYYGAMSGALYSSSDAGRNWHAVTQVPASGESVYGVGNVRFDLHSGTENGRTRVIYATVYHKGVFRSADAGVTWKKISGVEYHGPADSGTFQHIDIAGDGTLYLADWAGGTWKYRDGKWTDITPKNNPSIGAIAADPHSPERVFAFDAGGNPSRSLDGGKTWTELHKTRTAKDVPWLAFTAEDYMSVGTVVFDPKVKDRLWDAEGIGVWYADSNQGPNIAWQSLNAGIEQLVANDLVSPPGGKPVTASWDRALFYHADVDAYPAKHGPTRRFNSGWNVAYAAKNPRFLVATVYDHRQCCSKWAGSDNQSGYSTDGGRNWTIFPAIQNGTLPKELKFGDIAVAAGDTRNIVWLPTDNAAPYFTMDRGRTWQKIQLPGVSVPGSHPAFSMNRRVLTADTVRDHTFYLYHSNSRQIFTTADGGKTWKGIPVNANFPKQTGGDAKLKAVPGQANHLCFTPGFRQQGSPGLYCTADGGLQWTHLSGTSDVAAFGYGRSALGSRVFTIFIDGKIDGETGVWCTANMGESWGKLASYPLGIPGDLTAMDGDRDVFGRVYVGWGGSGYAYGDPGPNPPDNLCGGKILSAPK